MQFSIIIPTYNRAELIQPTLDSVLSQTYEGWECIVVDDGSTDHTAELIRSYTEKDERFRYIYQENAERSAARNNGIRNAKGEWICFLDSDDLYQENYLMELTTFIKSNSVTNGMIISDFIILNDNYSSKPRQTKLNGNIYDFLYLNPVSTSRVCVHKFVLNTFNFKEDVYDGEDTILWVSIASQFDIYFLNKPLIKYRIHDQNSVIKSSGSSINRLYGITDFFNTELSGGISRKVKKKVVSETKFKIAEYYQIKGKYIRAFYFSLMAIFTQWNHEQRKIRFFFILNLLPGFSFVWKKFKQ